MPCLQNPIGIGLRGAGRVAGRIASGITGGIGAGGHVCVCQLGQQIDELAASLAFSHVAAVQQDVGVRAQAVAPLSKLIGMLVQ